MCVAAGVRAVAVTDAQLRLRRFLSRPLEVHGQLRYCHLRTAVSQGPLILQQPLMQQAKHIITSETGAFSLCRTSSSSVSVGGRLAAPSPPLAAGLTEAPPAWGGALAGASSHACTSSSCRAAVSMPRASPAIFSSTACARKKEIGQRRNWHAAAPCSSPAIFSCLVHESRWAK